MPAGAMVQSESANSKQAKTKRTKTKTSEPKKKAAAKPTKAGTSKAGTKKATKQSKPKDQEGVMPVGAMVDPSAVGFGKGRTTTIQSDAQILDLDDLDLGEYLDVDGAGPSVGSNA